MKELVEIFDKACKNNMKNWDLAKFKADYPHLFVSIIEAMNEVKNPPAKNWGSWPFCHCGRSVVCDINNCEAKVKN